MYKVEFRSCKHPVQGDRRCLGILRPAKGYNAAEFEAAADYALGIGAHSYSSLQSILKNKRYCLLLCHPSFDGNRFFRIFTPV